MLCVPFCGMLEPDGSKRTSKTVGGATRVASWRPARHWTASRIFTLKTSVLRAWIIRALPARGFRKSFLAAARRARRSLASSNGWRNVRQISSSLAPTKARLARFATLLPTPNGTNRRVSSRIRRDKTNQGVGSIAVVTAGTSDIPVAEEAALTAETMGNTVDRIWDAGVAGIHRVLSERSLLQRSRVVIVAAGMEGALPSVVGGLVGVPVVAVPTSIGYGASFGGVAALLGMLNSCASNVPS